MVEFPEIAISMKFVIVDGIQETRAYYADLVKELVPHAEIFHCMSAEDAIFMVLDIQPDIILSSEILAFRSGFDLVRLLKKIKSNIPVIILAKDTSHALEAIKTNVFEYLVLPLNEERLKVAIEKAVQYIDKHIHIRRSRKFEKNTRLKISTTSGWRLVNLDEVCYCTADGSYTTINFCNGRKEYSSYNLGKIEKVLSDYHFMRINRSVIINLKKIHKIDKPNSICTMEMGEKMLDFSVSRSNMKKLENDSIV